VVGDGANDLAMIQKAGLGVAYHAKPAVSAAAAARIDHGDLTALLYAQGYRRTSFGFGRLNLEDPALPLTWNSCYVLPHEQPRGTRNPATIRT